MNSARARTGDTRRWDQLDRTSRDVVLDEFMGWSMRHHRVLIKLLVRGRGVAVCELYSYKPGRGRARVVMAGLCRWADSAHVRLELMPTDEWGADLGRLIAFYRSLGFGSDPGQELWIGAARPGLLVRYPYAGPVVGRASVPTLQHDKTSGGESLA